MEILLLILGLICIFLGMVGSVLPALPGTPLAWLGLLLLYLVPGIEINYWVLGVSLFFVILMIIMDYIIPAQGTKRFGGSKYGIWGTYVGLIVGFFIPPFGIILGPFIGAFAGEMIGNSSEPKRALRAALGSFLGFLISTFMQIIICVAFLIIFFIEVWNHQQIWFG